MRRLNRVSIIIFTLILVIAPITAQEASDPEANKESVLEFFVMEANRQWGRIYDHLTEDFVRHSVATEAVMPEFQVNSSSQYIDFLKATAAMCPDYYNDPQVVIAEGDYVTFYTIFHGTFVENGNPIVVPIMGVARFEDGKIAEMWAEWDNLTWNNHMMAAPVETTEVPITSIEDVVGLTRIYAEDSAYWFEMMADGTWKAGERGCITPGGCWDWGDYTVEGNQIHFLGTGECREELYDAFLVTQRDRVGLRYALVGDDCHTERNLSLNGKTIFFVAH